MEWFARVSLIASLLIASLPALADPGVGAFTNAKFNGSTTVVKVGGGELVYSFTTAVDSVAFRVDSPLGDLCFDTDTASATVGAARISVLRAVDSTNRVTISSIALPAVPFDGTDCLELTGGAQYWIKVDTGRAGAETPVATITGRAS